MSRVQNGTSIRRFPGQLTDSGLIGQLVANETKVSRDTLVQLFCLSSSGLIGSRSE